MRSHVQHQVPRMVEPASRLKIVLAIQPIELNVVKRGTVLQDGPTHINFTDPRVLDNSVCNFGLHRFVHLELSHEVESTPVFHICLLE